MIIGQAPSRTSNPATPFERNGVSKFSELSGLSNELVKKKIVSVNLLPEWPGKSRGGKGDAFPTKEAGVAAKRLVLGKYPDLILAIGRRVARALDLRFDDYMTAVRSAGRVFYVFPHPSGINRWWNDPRNRRRARRFLRDLIIRRTP